MIILRNLRKAFGPVTAVDGLSLQVEKGEIFGLLGPNGAGKTTTVHLAVGLLKPDAGEVRIADQGSPLDPACRARIGVAPQALALYEELTGLENLAFFGRLQGLSGSRLKSRVEWGLRFVALEDRGKDRVKTYSGGMKRRLNLAVALVHDPPVLLLDEPTAGVDPQSRNALFENIAHLKAEGRTVVYTTHYMEEAQRLCDRVGIIDCGRLMALDTVEGLIACHGGKSVLVALCDKGERRVATENPLETLLAINREEKIRSFHVTRPDLEQVFLQLTGRRLRDE